MKISAILFFLLLFIAAGAWLVVVHPEFLGDEKNVENTLKQKTVTFRTGVSVKVEIADTEQSRVLGLSGRQALADHTGMLFVFDDAGYPAIWMKDMNFAIDILWLDSASKIVTIAKSVGPESYPNSFTPAAKSKYVLELPAGYTEIYNISEGDSVDLHL